MTEKDYGAAPEAKRPTRIHYGYVVLATGTLGVTCALGMARLGYGLILPSMQAGLQIDNTSAGALATSNLVGYLVLAVIGGMLASRFGARAVISIGLFLVGVAMMLTGVARGFADAMVWRAVSGIGSGATNVPVMGLISGWFAPRRRGLASGIGVSGSSVGLIVLGPLVPRAIAVYQDQGWRICWLYMGAATLVAAVLAWLLLRNRPSDLGLQPVGDGGEAAAAAVSDNGAPHWGAVYRSAEVWQLGLVYTAYGFAYMVYMTFFTKALIAQGGYSHAAAGTLFMLMGWCSLLCGLIWGTVSDHLGRKQTLVMVYLIHAVSFALFALKPDPAGFTVSAVMFGLSAFSIPAITAAACADMLGTRLAPAALGFVTLFLGVGQALGPTVAGAMADVMHSYLPAVLLAAGVSLAGAIGAALLKPIPVREA